MRKKPDRSGNCRICGIWRQVLCRDHIHPRHLGGGDEPENIQWICANCHQDKTAEELRARNTGRKHSEEHRERIRAALAGRKRSRDVVEKIASHWHKPGEKELRGKLISAAKIGHEVSPETRAKLSAALKGRPLSPQHREKVVAAIKRRWASVKQAKA